MKALESLVAMAQERVAEAPEAGGPPDAGETQVPAALVTQPDQAGFGEGKGADADTG